VELSGLDAATIEDIEVSITWTKTDGSCASQNTGSAFHEEIGFAIQAPNGTSLVLVATNSYDGNEDIGDVTTVFSDTAASSHASGTPVSGTFLPDGTSGAATSLAALGSGGVNGTWQLLGTDTGGGDPLCVSSFSVTALPPPAIDGQPELINLPATATSLAAGAHHALVLDCNGEVWSWGANDFGELGSANGQARVQPEQVAGVSDVQAVATGSYHSLALHDDGRVSAWGYGDFGQLGLGTQSSHSTPQQLSNPTGVTQLAAGSFHSLALTANDQVFAWGFNHAGQLGQTDLLDRDVATQITALSGLSVARISAGDGYSLAMLSDGSVRSWGDNSAGQLGTGTIGSGSAAISIPLGLPTVVAIAAGDDHVLALADDGQVWSWGSNDAGQLGRNLAQPSGDGNPAPVPGLSGITSISAGFKFSVAVDSSGGVWTFGLNDSGQLGDGTTSSTGTPALVAGSASFTCGTAVTAGFNSVIARDCGAACDITDGDSDNISDLLEGSALSSPPDSDGGGVPNYQDFDSDNDGILDCFEAGDTLPGSPPVDTDGDGLPDYVDPDSDGDGVPDLVEGASDSDGDGLPDYLDTDSDDDGISDSTEGGGDLDGDGTIDSVDNDTDGDGIPDAVEGVSDADGDGTTNQHDLDSDGDGIGDAIEGYLDSDSDGLPDALDLDSDGDGIDDGDEVAQDANGDGVVDLIEAAGDVDRDGDGIPNFRDLDSDGDTIGDATEGSSDFDADGISDFLDLDSDGDGISDSIEGIGDPDGDGLANYLDEDSDGDGLPDAVEGSADSDGDGTPNFLDLDSDEDGIADGASAGVDADGDGEADDGSGDLDGDGTPDFLDEDIDGDGIANEDEGELDSDQDGIPDYLDSDADGDGIEDALEGNGDLDNDGIPDYLDTDADGDGVDDSSYSTDANGDPIPPDLDDDGIPNHLDDDADGDDIPDDEEGMDDADGDGLPNALDFDSDGDGIPDVVEGTGDIDGDASPDYLDSDPLDGPLADPDEDGLNTETEEALGLAPLQSDSDGDLIPDGTEFGLEEQAADSDSDGEIDALDADSDNDGYPDWLEAGFDPTTPADSDGDGTYDFRDPDSDDDGLLDADELLHGTSRLRGDSDGDGVGDAEEVAAATDPLSAAIPAVFVAAEGESAGCSASITNSTRPEGSPGWCLLVLLLVPLRRRRTTWSWGLRLSLALALFVAVTASGCDEPAPSPLPTAEPAAPSANAGEDQEVDEGSPVALPGLASDANEDISSYQWEQILGAEVLLVGAASPRADFQAPEVVQPTELAFRFTVTDSTGLSGSDEVSVLVHPVNLPPRASAGPDRWAYAGDTVSLSGAATDPDGGIAAWQWTIVQGPELTINNADQPEATLIAPDTEIPITLLIELEVTDNEGAFDSDAMLVTVNPVTAPGAPVNTAPTVSAGPDQQVLEETEVSLVGSAADGDGSIVSIAWSQYSGPSVALDNATAATTTFLAPTVTVETVLEFQVTATDEESASAGDEVRVTVLPVNDRPQVEAGANQVVGSESTVSLSGSASDNDGALVSTTWTQLSGPSIALVDASSPSTSFVAPSVSSTTGLVLRLSATDDEGATSHDEVLIEVQPTTPSSNAPPVVSAGSSQTVLSEAITVLQGQASDPDGFVDTVSWLQISGPGVTLSNPSSAATSFIAPVVAVPTPLLFRFSATDDEGAITFDDVAIQVDPPTALSNQPPTAAAGADQSVAAGSTVVLSGTAGDADGSVVSTTWLQTAGESVALTSSAGTSASFQAPDLPVSHQLHFRFVVTDDLGATSDDEVQVTVAAGTPLNEPPVVDAGTDQQFLTGDTVVLSGTASDPEGSSLILTWVQTAGPPVSLVNPGTSSAEFVAPNVTSSTLLSFELTAVDTGGAEDSDDVVITVLPPGSINQPPTADAGSDQLGVLGSTITLIGSGSDSDGSIASYTWIQVDGPAASLTTVSQSTTSFILFGTPCLTSMTFQLTVTDDDGASDTDLVTVALSPSGSTPLAPGVVLDLDSDDGGLTTSGSTWEHGQPDSGPGLAHSGDSVWATNLNGNYSNSVDEVLELPQLLLGDAVSPTLSFRMWIETFLSDGVSLEYFDAVTAQWLALDAGEPSYQANNALGISSWENFLYHSEYTLFTVPLDAFAGAALCVRARFVSSSIGADAGVYIDDIGLHDESDDPDGDGLLGVFDEYAVYGSDPFVADTDGDGFDDGAEVSAGDDPLNPAVYPGSPVLTPGTLLDFESDDGGLATVRTLWEHGAPSSGPGAAFSGSQLWATNLDGNFFNTAEEFLYLPRLDLSSSSAPTLTFRMWLETFLSDGVSLQFFDLNTSTWSDLAAGQPAYDGTDEDNNDAWTSFSGGFTDFSVPLSNFAGAELRLRFRFIGSSIGIDAGAYIDDIEIVD